MRSCPERLDSEASPTVRNCPVFLHHPCLTAEVLPINSPEPPVVRRVTRLLFISRASSWSRLTAALRGFWTLLFTSLPSLPSGLYPSAADFPCGSPKEPQCPPRFANPGRPSQYRSPPIDGPRSLCIPPFLRAGFFSCPLSQAVYVTSGTLLIFFFPVFLLCSALCWQSCCVSKTEIPARGRPRRRDDCSDPFP